MCKVSPLFATQNGGVNFDLCASGNSLLHGLASLVDYHHSLHCHSLYAKYCTRAIVATVVRGKLLRAEKK